MKKTKKIVQARESIHAELTKQLGGQAKTILNKIDSMVAQKKKRQEIEAMLTAEIARCTKENSRDMVVFIT